MYTLAGIYSLRKCVASYVALVDRIVTACNCLYRVYSQGVALRKRNKSQPF